MGREARDNEMLRSRLVGLTIAVDVQHLYRSHKPDDRGAVFLLNDGTRVSEGEAAVRYASALTAFLRARGAVVHTNDPVKGILTEHYSRRNREADVLGCNAYLACHVNAGRGSYAALEYRSGHPSAVGPGNPSALTAARLAHHIGERLTSRFAEIAWWKGVPLAKGDRGLVCIGGFPADHHSSAKPPAVALLLEPFFGDHPNHQNLFPRLTELGEAIGEGVDRWWWSLRV